MSKQRPILTIALLAVLANLGISASSSAQQTKPDEKKHEAVRKAIRELTREAQQAMRQEQLPAEEADFASRFDAEVPEEDVLQALAEPVHREPFIDAYVRWQLTSFEPDLSKMSDRSFRRLLQSAPRLQSNPMADERLLRVVQEAEETDYLSGSDIRELRGMVQQAEQHTTRAEQMNKPAEAFRTWVREHLGTDNLRGLQWLIENCAANIEAGWPVQGEKTRLTKAFKEAADAEDFSRDQKRTLAQQTQRLAGMHRRFIRNVEFLANDDIQTMIGTSGVSRGDVERWIQSLAGKSERRRKRNGNGSGY